MIRRLLLASMLLMTAAIGLKAEASSFDSYRFGALAGYSRLTGDPGGEHPDGVAYGFTLGTVLNPVWAINLDVLATNHPDTDHREIALGADAYLSTVDDYWLVPRLSFGVNNISNTLKRYERSASTFGVYAGVGADYSPWKGWRTGLEFRYNFPVKAETNLLNGGNLKTVDVNWNALVRVVYEFPEFDLGD